MRYEVVMLLSKVRIQMPTKGRYKETVDYVGGRKPILFRLHLASELPRDSPTACADLSDE